MQDLERLVGGFQRFQQQYYEDAPMLYRNLRDGQHPSTLLIGCCDSRVDPAMLLGCDPGDIFTVRNVANLVPPCSKDRGLQGVLAAIQFAVEQLQVSRIIVLGHAQCGGIRALMERRIRRDGETDYLGRWMDIAEPAREQVLRQMPDASKEERRRACEQASILISLRNLEDLPFVRRAVDAGSLSLHGWYFDLVAGALLAYSPRADTFLPIVCPLLTEPALV
ncbi:MULTISPECIES: carbonic anhydrase [Achromobacter]|uniref:Carbonic anhydrase n=1 Tax=Achromobacter animicus TaxID=1389935 RepID=A0A6S6YZ46_9BURK|nr:MULTISPECIES: carbonic anhydrase [Achromobacter]MBV7501494.1 carbonic anhydrase [Achromobacter sp. ACM05]MCG7324776.1 carbonic anhydrase [Achromobacter sp. ACRQX]MDH0681497.1 carbonic anhydrase [Achromobacter animicus]CAB3654135.1 Carbonic anhydrase 1 [Achromobacter animicus]CAB3815331.1 Carbonic anhydrase 1 [Achromobacter animicus]